MFTILALVFAVRVNNFQEYYCECFLLTDRGGGMNASVVGGVKR